MNNSSRPKRAPEAPKFDLAVAVRRVVLRAGGRPVPGYWPAREFDIETAAGTLRVRGHERFIACRFSDVERAVANLGAHPYDRLNPCSGKWNWHPSDLSP